MQDFLVSQVRMVKMALLVSKAVLEQWEVKEWLEIQAFLVRRVCPAILHQLVLRGRKANLVYQVLPDCQDYQEFWVQPDLKVMMVMQDSAKVVHRVQKASKDETACPVLQVPTDSRVQSVPWGCLDWMARRVTWVTKDLQDAMVCRALQD
jgi:hypothetical protein